LLIRLNAGVPASAVELTKQAGSRLTRGDYLQLCQAGLCGIDAIESSEDAVLLAHLGNDKEKLAVVRQAVDAHRQQEREHSFISPILEPYES
jgi:hypothetical protein